MFTHRKPTTIGIAVLAAIVGGTHASKAIRASFLVIFDLFQSGSAFIAYETRPGTNSRPTV